MNENFLIYGTVLLFSILMVAGYLLIQRRTSVRTRRKIDQAKADGLHEPVSLHPVVDPNSCIQTGACISACPEKDILGIYKGKATAINTSLCIGHGACFHACPTQAITLCIGTEKRGVDLPHVSQNFETNIPGIFIAGELGGMGLIKNAVEQGKQAVENMAKHPVDRGEAMYDLLIAGAGPAGISATLAAKKSGLKTVTLDQDTLGGTVYTFPRSKIIMTAPMDLPLHGRVKLKTTTKAELLGLWEGVIEKHQISITEGAKVEDIARVNGYFKTTTADGNTYTSTRVLLAIGRRGTPRKLDIPGEDSGIVTYRLLEPELIQGEDIIVVGGGDSAIEAALALCDQNRVILSYRGEAFKRLKVKNRELITRAGEEGRVDIRFNSNLLSAAPESVLKGPDYEEKIKADRIFVFAGGELPTAFLERAGIKITKRYGDAMMKH